MTDECDRCERESETVDESLCVVCRDAIADPGATTGGESDA